MKKTVFLCLSGLVAASLLLGTQACSKKPHFPQVEIYGREAVVDLAKVQPGKPLFLCYHFKGKEINFFVIKVDGKMLSFLDACEQCFPQKKGYAFADGYLICRTCGMRYSIYGIENGIGNCYPIKLEGATIEGRYTIPLNALEAAVEKF